MRILFSLPVLMLGFIAVGLYIKDGTIFERAWPLPFVSTPTPSPTRSPAVDGATSIVLPDVNPVLRISTPSMSIFAPTPIPSGQPESELDYLDALQHPYGGFY